MSDDRSHEKAMIHDLSPLLDLRRAEVDVQAVVVRGHGFEVEVAHAIEFQLEGERRFQVPVYPILVELKQVVNQQISHSELVKIRSSPSKL